MPWKPGARHAAVEERPALPQDLAQVVDTIAPLQHINHVLGKLGVANRTETVGRARRPGLIR